MRLVGIPRTAGSNVQFLAEASLGRPDGQSITTARSIYCSLRAIAKCVRSPSRERAGVFARRAVIPRYLCPDLHQPASEPQRSVSLPRPLDPAEAADRLAASIFGLAAHLHRSAASLARLA